MMKRITVALAVVGAGIALMGQPQVCQSGWCPDIKCLNSSICMDCVCMSRDYSGGVCVDINAVPQLKADGYRLMP